MATTGHRRLGSAVSIAAAATWLLQSHTAVHVAAYQDEKAASGARIWVDPKTPGEVFAYTSSRGAQWELVMSDEFDTPGRKFRPGQDHLWTAIEAPDGVNAALEYYSNDLATTECQDGNVVCYLKINVLSEPRTISVWNENKSPPGMQDITMFYQSAMLQSWNKFCFQGGMVEVRVKLPGGLKKNPDVASGGASRVKTAALYPTWPGIWMMGNLGRALFTRSTTRMWPFSYNKCEPKVYDATNQRISACDASPGFGMNPNQGRGAPEIDILEGGGLQITSSLQIAPGMPTEYRRVAGESEGCIIGFNCETRGANMVGVPSETYEKRGHKSWYQGLRYAFNPFCAKNETQGTQTLAKIQASLKKGISANRCDLEKCPASFDVNSDISVIPNSKTNGAHWGINSDGSCFATMNTYDGALLCSAGNGDPACMKQGGGTILGPGEAGFQYRLDALSANWPIHVAMYTDFLAYQVEWVPGNNGYIRWMLERQPIFEIPAESLINPPQDSAKSNPTKMLPEEPMYLIMNVALSSSWSAEPPNAGRACRDHGDTKDPDTIGLSELVCDQFPLDMKIDYVRVYQDVSPSSTMSVGCDPKSHPTKQWIEGHIKEYQNDANPVVAVAGGAMCVTDGDCTAVKNAGGSGTCVSGRCVCASANWSGPRCTVRSGVSGAVPGRPGASSTEGSRKQDGAPIGMIAGIGLAAAVALFFVIYIIRKIRMWLYFRSQPDYNHSVVGRDTMDTSSLASYPSRPSESRAWLHGASNNQATLPTVASFGRHRAQGLQSIAETPSCDASPLASRYESAAAPAA